MKSDEVVKTLLITILICYILIKMTWLIPIAILIAIHFIPSIIAFNRKHKNFMPILITNCVPIIGFIVSLIWAFTDNVRFKGGE